ncbi:hypothetical protein CRENBAI_013686 [Crenichthys baileyi]|uniref:Uncharacterized protein n=1 Tax=Crenichthys baileyi TaxID=28760 RepID=A0AAV9RAN8_9TELE
MGKRCGNCTNEDSSGGDGGHPDKVELRPFVGLVLLAGMFRSRGECQLACGMQRAERRSSWPPRCLSVSTEDHVLSRLLWKHWYGSVPPSIYLRLLLYGPASP